jgi:hypothetical protein
MTATSPQIFKSARLFRGPVILSEAKDLRRWHDRLLTVEHDCVRAQHCCAPTCPDVNFNEALFLTLSSDRTV